MDKEVQRYVARMAIEPIQAMVMNGAIDPTIAIIAQDLSFLPVLLSPANIAEVFSGQLLPSAAIV